MADRKADSGQAVDTFACACVTYLNWSKDEEGALEVLVECDGGPGGDCGYSVDVTQQHGVTVEEMRQHAMEHRHHSMKTAKR